MRYYLFNAKTNGFIMECNEAELECLRKICIIVDEQPDTGCDAYGNEFNFVNVFVNF